ncbi:MAG TPA: GvpL/GvpF family gas vesicle protein [Mycobacteriales bacterium]|nr:GvpL/GvpF family gas vesicle protein [Mycobacteriales bacterium]
MSRPDGGTVAAVRATSTGCYLYAVIGGDGTGVAGLPGIEPGGPVDVVTAGGIGAVISAVDTDAMRQGGASADIDEDGWLVRAARSHEQVVLAAFHSAPTVPMRFGIVHADRAAVERLLATYGAELRGELARLGGAAEWNVKAYIDRSVVAARFGADNDADGERPAVESGRGYLLRERARRDADARVREAIAAHAADLASQLSAVAVDLTAIPLGGEESRRPVLGAVCLVERADDARLTGVVERFAASASDDGLTVELTGPWPPYHFTSLRLGPSDE